MVYNYCEFEKVILSDYRYEFISIDNEDDNRSMVKEDCINGKVYSVLTSKLLPEYVYDKIRNS